MYIYWQLTDGRTQRGYNLCSRIMFVNLKMIFTRTYKQSKYGIYLSFICFATRVLYKATVTHRSLTYAINIVIIRRPKKNRTAEISDVRYKI